MAISNESVKSNGVLAPIQPEQLASVQFIRPQTVDLVFADGLHAHLSIEALDLPEERINWSSVEMSRAGDAITVTGVKGDLASIDSATLRYLVDKDYASAMDQSVESLQLSRDELKKLAHDNPPPPEWFAQPERKQ